MNKKQKNFLEFVKSECKKNGVVCDLRPVSYLKLEGNIKCSGYFDDDCEGKQKLVVATKRKDWLEILVHEYCHMTQWLDQKNGTFLTWNSALESISVVNDWLKGKNVKNIRLHMGRVRDLELDNEKRSASIIKKWDLGIDLDSYIKKANAYILFYNHMLTTRRWSNPKNQPYGNKRLISAMSNRFRMSYKTNSKKVQKIFTEENI